MEGVSESGACLWTGEYLHDTLLCNLNHATVLKQKKPLLGTGA